VIELAFFVSVPLLLLAALVLLYRWRIRLVCLVRGHSVVPTGRHGLLLREWLCLRCWRLFVSHVNFDNSILLLADEDSDRIFRDTERLLELFPPDE
jgi:hypothetical protein